MLGAGTRADWERDLPGRKPHSHTGSTLPSNVRLWGSLSPLFRPHPVLRVCHHPCKSSYQATEMLFNPHLTEEENRYREGQQSHIASDISVTHCARVRLLSTGPWPPSGLQQTQTPFIPGGGCCSWQGGGIRRWSLKGR